ncbi:MAG TPA: phytoene desaturase family protein [Chitinophagales bacterium]|nr:phytoene desaturase [Chitinophagales bacterium]HMU68436.1 phytoene desaturase family protein [Chitinophagales bacterium]HMZ88260.1 phytoene desaturase family protein [Chitinophagales bacterium]HNA57392.1 phytoene desaturase family protein [Chitinophagales bacterium]HNJ90248.1 phytoene desaturase family protein [Chitinophagales bacterium]
MAERKHIIVIGAGFSGISAACALAAKGYSVTILEKNESAGGRCSVFSEQGFTFDMGPSWYWMPDVFEWFFNTYGSSVEQQYALKRLDPGYRIVFGPGDVMEIPASTSELKALFESIEPGSGIQLQKFLDDAAYKYEVGMKDLVFRPCNSIMEFAELRMVKALFTMQLFTSLRSEVYAKFKNERIRKILEFPVYFLGALPSNTPALYSILNYADLVLGTWYPMGGMYKIIEGMQRVAEGLGVQFQFNSPVEKIIVEEGRSTGVKVHGDFIAASGIIAAADYHHVEQKLLDQPYRNYDETYWDKKIFAPSAIIYYLGVKGRVKNLLHHNLFFDQSFEQFADEIYTDPRWPEQPLFYVSAPSVTDPTVAPAGDENLFILVPVAAGLKDTAELREEYYHKAMDRLEAHCGEEIKSRVVYKREFAPGNFVDRYNACKGNAYGLANTLMQTAIFKPKMRNKRVRNLCYAGQLTVPGPGVPPSLISGYVAAQEMEKLVGH